MNFFRNSPCQVLVPFKLVRAIVRETLMWLYVDPGSILYDSPLNEEGLKQARDLDEILVQWDETHPNAADARKARALAQDHKSGGRRRQP